MVYGLALVVTSAISVQQRDSDTGLEDTFPQRRQH